MGHAALPLPFFPEGATTLESARYALIATPPAEYATALALISIAESLEKLAGDRDRNNP